MVEVYLLSSLRYIQLLTTQQPALEPMIQMVFQVFVMSEPYFQVLFQFGSSLSFYIKTEGLKQDISLLHFHKTTSMVRKSLLYEVMQVSGWWAIRCIQGFYSGCYVYPAKNGKMRMSRECQKMWYRAKWLCTQEEKVNRFERKTCSLLQLQNT